MNILFLDIEAAPAKAYIWDLKTRYVPLQQVAEDGYILCFAYHWEGQKKVHAVTRWQKGGEEAMVHKAWELLDKADVVMHYNGDNYDLPRLNAEFLKYGLGPPTPYMSVDLFKTVRKKFRVLSKSMNHMLNLLSLETKLNHKGFDLWRGCMDGNRQDRKEMVEYNVQDVNVMTQLYEKLIPWIDNLPNRALWMDETIEPTCRCGSTNLRFKGYKRTKVLSYKQYKCNDCGSYMRERQAADRGRKDILTY